MLLAISAVPGEPADDVTTDRASPRWAGDAFVAGYLAEVLAGLTVEERLATAVTLGAFACVNPGDGEGFPSRDELTLLTASEPVQR